MRAAAADHAARAAEIVLADQMQGPAGADLVGARDRRPQEPPRLRQRHTSARRAARRLVARLICRSRAPHCAGVEGSARAEASVRQRGATALNRAIVGLLPSLLPRPRARRRRPGRAQPIRHPGRGALGAVFRHDARLRRRAACCRRSAAGSRRRSANSGIRSWRCRLRPGAGNRLPRQRPLLYPSPLLHRPRRDERSEGADRHLNVVAASASSA